MKITRIIGGKSVDIELTPGELLKAYNEQKFKNMCCDVKNKLGDYLEGEEYLTLSENDDFIKAVAEETQDVMECMGLSCEYALENAIDNNKADYLKEEVL